MDGSGVDVSCAIALGRPIGVSAGAISTGAETGLAATGTEATAAVGRTATGVAGSVKVPPGVVASEGEDCFVSATVAAPVCSVDGCFGKKYLGSRYIAVPSSTRLKALSMAQSGRLATTG